jgi:hypothetical protein
MSFATKTFCLDCFLIGLCRRGLCITSARR